MSADFDWKHSPIRENFKRNFCSEELTPEQARSFDANLCKKAGIISGMFKSIFSQSQKGMDEEAQEKAIKEKFELLWEWKDETWSELNESERKICDLNLIKLDSSAFGKRQMSDNFRLKQEIRAETKSRQSNFGAPYKALNSLSIKGINQDHLQNSLFMNGQVGIDRSKQIILPVHLNYMRDDPVVVLTYRPDQDPLFRAHMPQDGRWKLLNYANQDVSKGEPCMGKRMVPLQPGENKFCYGDEMLFSITVPGEVPPSASSSSSARAASSSAGSAVGRLKDKEFFKDLSESERRAYELFDGVETKRSSCFDILGLNRNASPAEIEKAYRKLTLKFHPDKHEDNPDYEKAFKILGEAKRLALMYANQDQSIGRFPKQVPEFFK